MAHKCAYKRRLYLIDKEFQFGYLLTWLTLVLGLVGGNVLTTLGLFFFFRDSLFNYVIEINSGLAVFFIGLSLYYMIRHSHRVAGPAYRLECVMRELARGTWDLDNKVNLRRKDYLKHLANALNEVIETRAIEHHRVKNLVAGMSELDSAIQNVSGISPELKEISRVMFSEVVDLAQAQQGLTASWKGTPAEKEPAAQSCVATCWHSAMSGMSAADDSEAVLVESPEANDFRRAMTRSGS